MQLGQCPFAGEFGADGGEMTVHPCLLHHPAERTMQLIAYLNFNGQCAAAFKFYEQLLGGKIATIMTYGESPLAGQSPPEWHDAILHVTLHVGDTVLMGSDAPPDRFEKPQGFAVTVDLDDPAEADRIFESPRRKRDRHDADPADLLGPALRHAHRPVRHPLDDQLREPGVIAASSEHSFRLGKKKVDRLASLAEQASIRSFLAHRCCSNLYELRASRRRPRPRDLFARPHAPAGPDFVSRKASPTVTDDLQAMFRHLDKLTTRPDLARLVEELSRFDIDLDDLSQYLHFAESGYKRNLVRAGAGYQAWLLCWKNGQRSPIHDHSGSACVVRVLRGTLTETLFERAPTATSRQRFPATMSRAA